MGDPRHAGSGAPHRRPREGRHDRQHLLRPGQPRLHGAHPAGQDRRHRPRRSRRSRSTTRTATPAVLVLGWGSTYGPIGAAVPPGPRAPATAVARRTCATSTRSRATSARCCRYDKVVIPEMNLGQLALLIRASYLVDAISYNQVRGLPFNAAELADDAAGSDRCSEPASSDHAGCAEMARVAGLKAEGLQVRPGGPLVPGLRRLRHPRRRAGLPARARHPAREHRVRLRHRLLVPVPVLHEHLRHALDPRPRAGDRDRPRDLARRTCRSGWSPATATRCRSAATT